MDKELALIYEYKTAPQELKDAADAHRKNANLLAKRAAALKTAQAEVDALTADYQKTEKAFRVALKAWTPAGT